MSSHDVLALCSGWPVLQVPEGASLIEEGVRTGRLYVVREGRFEVVRGGARIVTIGEPGAFLGEMSAVLGTAPTATVTALAAGSVHVLEDAAATVLRDPRALHAIAQLLARRLQAVTAYLTDLKQQYAGTDSHLALMDQVLAELMVAQPPPARLPMGSERADVPGY